MRIQRYLPEVLFIAAIAGILVYLLFAHPIVGVANNGDFSRLTDWFGLKPAVSHPRDALYLFTVRLWEWHRQFEIHYPSSEVLFIGASLLPALALSRGGLYDIRFLGGTHAVLFLLVMLLLTQYTRTLPLGRRLLLYGLTAFMFADIGYVAYFNSFFSEPAGFIFLGATVAFALVLVAYREPGRRRMLLIAGYFISSLLFSTAKLQNFILAIPLAALGYRLAMSCCPADKMNKKRFRGFVIGLTAVLPLTGIAYFEGYNHLTDRMKTYNVCNAIFFELLSYSPAPEVDAQELGLDPQFIQFRGKYAAFQGIPDAVREAAGRVGTAGVARFYMHHPDRFVNLLDRVAMRSFCQRPTYLGNYERSYVLADGAQPAVPRMYLPDKYYSRKFAVWSSFKERAVPKTLCFLIGFVVLNALVVAMKWIRFDRTPGRRMITEIHGMLLIMALMQFLIVVVGEGTADIVKHLFLFNLLCEVCFVFLFMYAVAAIRHLAVTRDR